MLSKIKKILIILFLSLFIITVSLVLYVYFNEEKIISFVISSLNEKIDTKVSSSKVDVSLLKNFPNVSVTFENLIIESSRKYQEKHQGKNHLLTANKLHIHFNLYHFLHKNFLISGISMEDGNLNVLIDQKGENNFKFWKEDHAASQETVEFALKKIVLKRMQVHYIDLQNNILAESYFEMISLTGSLEMNESKAHILVSGNNLKTNFDYLKKLDKNFELKSDLLYKSEKLELNNLSLTYPDLDLEASLQCVNSNLSLDYHVKAPNILSLNEFMVTFIPGDLKVSEGSLDVNGTVTLKKNLWNQSCSVHLTDLNIDYKKATLENISGKLDINGFYPNFKLEIKELNSIYKNSKFTLEGHYNKNSKDDLRLNLQAALELNDIKNLIDSSLLYPEDGKLDLKIDIKNLEHFSSNEKFLWTNFLAEGDIKLSGAYFRTYNNLLTIKNLNTSIKIKDGDLKLRNIGGTVNSSSVDGSLDVSNLFAFLDAKNDLLIHGELKTDSLLPIQFIPQNTSYVSSSETTNSRTINGKIAFECKHFIYNKIKFQDIKTQLLVSNNNYSLNQLRTKFCQGELENGTISINTAKGLTIQSSLIFKNLNIHELFSAFDNFNQHQILAENIEGHIDGSCQSSMQWNEKMEFDTRALKGSASFEIRNGRLTNFKPVEKLSQFLEVEDINNIKFKTIKNTISIRDKIMFIPEMSINSTALNLNISGQHSFDNEYEYHFNMLLTDLLLPKLKKKKSEDDFGKVEEENLNRTRIFVKMSGKDDKYKIAYDNRKAMEVFSGKMIEEKKRLKNILAEEFQFSKDTTITEKKERKKLAIENEEFIPTEQKTEIKTAKKKTTAIEWKDE